MENASKALIMAASVLLSIMIISVGVVLFDSFGNTGAKIISQIEETQISEFNSQFYKYYGKTTKYNSTIGKYEQETIKVTAHDIISIANLAKKNNEQYEFDEIGKDENTNYVQIDFKNKKNLENWSEEDKIKFIEDNSMNGSEIKYFYCSSIELNSIGRVMYVKFDEL
jgi:hypothetical protein